MKTDSGRRGNHAHMQARRSKPRLLRAQRALFGRQRRPRVSRTKPKTPFRFLFGFAGDIEGNTSPPGHENVENSTTLTRHKNTQRRVELYFLPALLQIQEQSSAGRAKIPNTQKRVARVTTSPIHDDAGELYFVAALNKKDPKQNGHTVLVVELHR